MKKILIILGLMMLLSMSMAMAVVIDDFSVEGRITTSSVNSLGYNYYVPLPAEYNDYFFVINGELRTTSSTYEATSQWDMDDYSIFKFSIKPLGTLQRFYLGNGHSFLFNTPPGDDIIYTNPLGSTTYPEVAYENGWWHFELEFSETQTILRVNGQELDTFATSPSLGQKTYSIEGASSTLWDNLEYGSSNTAPVINSINPNERIELTSGETQLYTSDVTDADGDASYSWTLGATEVSTSETYLADWGTIEPGIYTLTLNVSDAEYSDTASTTLEIRAVGGSSSFSIVQEVVEEEQADQATPQTSAFSKFTGNVGDFFSSIGNWFGGLFR